MEDGKIYADELFSSDLGMTRDRLQFIWRHFHVQRFEKDELDDDGEDKDKDKEGLVEQIIKDVNHEQEQDASEEELKDDDEFNKVVWFKKIKVLVNHVQDVRTGLIMILVTFFP